MQLNAPRSTAPILAGLALTAALVAGCSAGAGASPATSPSAAAASATETMMDHGSPTPAETMMDHGSPTPAETTMDHGSPTAGAAMTDGTGSFHGVDGQASGTVALLHLANGDFELSFESFSIASSDHIHVLLVDSPDVTATSQVDISTSLDLGQLSGTSGMVDIPLPMGIAATTAMGYHAVVLWDTAMGHAIAAAPLGS
jgi:hypothetical protein